MLSQYLINEIDESKIITEFNSSIMLLEYYNKELSLSSYVMEDGETNTTTEAKKEEFFQRIGNAIKKAFEAIGNFFRNLFKKNKANDEVIDNVSNKLQEAAQKGESAESIIENLKNLTPQQRDDLLDFLTTWMSDPSKKPSVLSKNAAVELNKLTNTFNQFDQLLKSDVKILQARGNDLMKAIEQYSRELKLQMNITDTSIQNNDGDAKKYFKENGISTKESSKILETFSKVLDNLQRTIAQAMNDPEKAKILESYNNVSVILKESMSAGKLISMRLNELGKMTPELEQALQKDVGLKLNAKLAGKGNFDIYNANGSSKVAKRGRALGKAVGATVTNDFIDAGMDRSKYSKYADVANTMAVNKHKQDVANIMRGNKPNGS